MTHFIKYNLKNEKSLLGFFIPQCKPKNGHDFAVSTYLPEAVNTRLKLLTEYGIVTKMHFRL